jgi:hypothetical protein
MNNGYVTSSSQLLARLQPQDRGLVARLLRRGLSAPPSPAELRAMSVLSHPASGVVQHVIEGDHPVFGHSPSKPEPGLDVARLRSRVTEVEGWQHLAACKGIDPTLAVPEDDEIAPRIAMACAACSVRIDCLAWGVERIEQQGILGGYPRSDRVMIRALLSRGWSQR